MPKFKAGDRIRVPHDAHGAPLELLGAEGIIIKVTDILETGSLEPGMVRTSHKEQLYDVQFGELDKVSWVYESWLELG